MLPLYGLQQQMGLCAIPDMNKIPYSVTCKKCQTEYTTSLDTSVRVEASCEENPDANQPSVLVLCDE